MRNGYIDIVRFLFAIIIAEFHVNSGIFPGGRMAVEGFFMISGYLMMKYIERDPYPRDNLGVSTARFLTHKYKGLFPVLLPSVALGFGVFSAIYDRSLRTILDVIPLLLFEIFPLRNAGYAGHYVVGISWYLSSMFIALALLYPLCKRFKSSFSLTVCPLLAVMLYGILSHTYGDLAVGGDFLENSILNTGLMRGLASCSLGVVIYEISLRLESRQITAAGRILFTVAELAGFAFFFYTMHFHAKSEYDYVLVYVIFFLLLIGINGLSATASVCRAKWTKPLGTASTLIVLNHYCWTVYLKNRFGNSFGTTSQIWIYIAAVFASCVAVYLSSLLIRKCLSKLSTVKLWT